MVNFTFSHRDIMLYVPCLSAKLAKAKHCQSGRLPPCWDMWQSWLHHCLPCLHIPNTEAGIYAEHLDNLSRIQGTLPALSISYSHDHCKTFQMCPSFCAFPLMLWLVLIGVGWLMFQYRSTWSAFLSSTKRSTSLSLGATSGLYSFIAWFLWLKPYTSNKTPMLLLWQRWAFILLKSWSILTVIST